MLKRFFAASMALASCAQPSFADIGWSFVRTGTTVEIYKFDWDDGIREQVGDLRTDTGLTNSSVINTVVKGDVLFISSPSTNNDIHIYGENGYLGTDPQLDDQVVSEMVSGGGYPLLRQSSDFKVKTIHGLTLDHNGISTYVGDNIIRKDANTGAIHIGKNSLVTNEVGGVQQLYATGADGGSIDIDITNGSRLLINGRDVEKSIDNVGALSAALGSVPVISADSQFTCGFGAGTHSSAYALSGGCASRVSDRVSVNAALATVINNHTGDSDDNLSARAGFTFRLGKIDYSPKVAARKAAELHDKVAKLEERNESLLALLQAQASRLERLEKIASGQLSLLGDRASSD